MNTVSMLRRNAPWFLCAGLAVLALAAVPAVAQSNDDDSEEKLAELRSKMYDLYEQEEYDDAIACAEKMLKLDPESGETMYNLGCLWACKGESAKALDYLEKAAKNGFRDANQYANDKDLRKLRNESRFKKLMADLRGEKDDAEADEKPAKPEKKPAKATPKTPAEKAREVQRLTQRLIEESGKGNVEKALELAEQARDLMPEQGLTHYNVGCMLARLNRTDDAIKSLEKAVELGFDDIEQFEKDSDLASLRKDTRFKKLMAKIGGEDEEPDVKPTPAVRKPEGSKPTEKPATPPARAPAAGSARVEWHISLPAGFKRSKTYPLIVALHGNGQSLRIATEDWEDAASDAGAILLTPQGGTPKGEDGFEWGKDVDAIEAAVMKSIEAAKKEYKIDENRIVLVGFSQGAWATFNLGLRHPDKFAAIIPVCGGFEDDMASVAAKTDLKDLRAYILIGDQDERLSQNQRAVKILKKSGAKVEFVDMADTGHAWPKKRVREQLKALNWAMSPPDDSDSGDRD